MDRNGRLLLICYLHVMTMRWDPLLTAAVATELDNALSGERLNAVFIDRGAGTLHAYFRGATLLADLDPARIGIEIREAVEPPEGARTFPCGLASVEAIPDERILVLVLPKLRGRGGVVRMVLELVPNRGNATVVEGNDWTVRHVLANRGGARTPQVGRPYPLPHSTRRGLEPSLSLEEWHDLLVGEEPKARRRVLLRNVALVSPVNAPVLLGDAQREGVDESGEAVRTALEAGHGFWMRLREIGSGRAASEAYVMDCPWGPQPYPICLPGHACRQLPSLLEAIREVRSTAGITRGLIPSGLTGAVADALDVASKRTAKLRGELERAPEPQELRRIGDLLLAHLKQVPKGVSRVSLPGFDGEQVTVTLDPTLAPQDNAARYYDRAGRAERARERLPGLIRQSREKAEALAGLWERVRAGTATEQEIRVALPERELRARTPEGETVAGLPYRIYRTSGGLEVRVGRGSGANDDLTFRHSKPDDIWLHARDSAGAHVILRWDAREAPPARDLHEAAVLAAVHSKARTSGSVPVDWTHRKYVRKPRKSPPGSVVPERVKTLFVEPDPTLPDRLSE